MRRISLMLLAVLAIAGTASAYTYVWTGAVDNSWATPGNWTCSDGNAPAGPPTAVNVWSPAASTGDNPVINSGNVVIGSGVTAAGVYVNVGVDANSAPATVTVEEGGTFFPAIARFGQFGASADLIQNGGLVKTVWVWNQPRTATSTTVSTYTMNAGVAEFGEFNLLTDTASLYIAPGAIFKELGSANYYEGGSGNYYKPIDVRLTKLQGYIDSGKITTAPGYSLQLQTLAGQGYGGYDAIQIAVVPEPMTLALLAIGGLMGLRRRR